MTWRHRLGALVVCSLLALLHTWPLASDIEGQSRLDNADTALNTWIVAWVAHALPRRPLTVFDAPIFHPDPRTLAYSEHLLAQGAMAVPLRAAGLSPVATYNVLVIVGLALSAWAMWLLVASWTGDVWAGAVAGMAFAFNAHSLTRFGQIQGLHLEFVPIALLAMDRLVRRGWWRDALLLGAGIALTGLTSVYLLTFIGGAAVAGVAARVAEWRTRATRTLALTGAGVGAGALLLAPVLWPYWRLNRDAGLVRPISEVAAYAATWHDYLATSGRLHYAWWSAPHHTSATSLFPGIMVIALALAALWRPGVHRGRVLMLLGITALGVWLSFGPSLPGYSSLYAALPPFRAIRVASRWGVLWLIGTAGLAGVGLALARARLAGAARLALSVAAVVLVTGEAARAPMDFTPTPPVDAIYTRVAALHDAVLLEYPIYPSASFNLNAPYLVAQTAHGQRLVAGYSGFVSPAYDGRVETLNSFPGAAAQALIHELGVTHIVLHLPPLHGVLTAERQAAIDRAPWLRLEQADAETRLYAVVDVPAAR